MDGVITKPVNFKTLLRQIGSIMSNRVPADA
jgi:hypothetical protein